MADRLKHRGVVNKHGGARHWTKYGGARHTNSETPNKWYCQICTKQFKKNDDKHYLPLMPNNKKDTLRICTRCSIAVKEDGYTNWAEIYDEYLKEKEEIYFKEQTVSRKLFLTEKVIDEVFKRVKGKDAEFTVVIEFMEQLANDELKLTPGEIRERAEDILIRIKNY